MKIKALILTLGILSLFSCTADMYNKRQVYRSAVKSQKKQRTIIQEEGNILKLIHIGNIDSLNVVEEYEFDEYNAQIKYTMTASCEPCFQQNLQKVLNNYVFVWRKLNDSTYISSQGFKVFLNIHKTAYSFDISKHNYSNEQRKALIRN